MQTCNIHDAKTQLSRLVDEAAKGEAFVIAKAGKPMVKVTAIDAPDPAQVKRIGFMAGEIEVPEDFSRVGDGELPRATLSGSVRYVRRMIVRR